jgi:phage shock protein B
MSIDVTAISIVGIVFGSILAGLYLISNMIARTLGGRNSARLSEEESQLMQELFYGLKKMEQRVESLETILIERDRRREG